MFVTGLKRAIYEGSLPEIVQYSPYYQPSPKDQTFIFYSLKGTFLFRISPQFQLIKPVPMVFSIHNLSTEVEIRISTVVGRLSNDRLKLC